MVRFTLPRMCYHRNLPKKYIQKEKGIEQDPAYKSRYYRYTEDRPWSPNEKMKNHPGKKWNPWNNLVHAPLKDWSIYRGDLVQVLIGHDKGKRGEVTQIVRERNWCFVKGMNLKYESYAKYDGLPGKMYARELPLDVVYEVSLIDPTDNIAADVEWRYTEEGERVRVSKRTGRIIPIPVAAEETYEYKTRTTYLEQPKDTEKEALAEITYKPVARTFEEDIMRSMGIVETRKPPRTFWY